MQSKVNFLLHPIRMRIMQSLLGGKEHTAQEISQKVSDVPQATLYRHLNKLVEAEILEVVKENRVRGTVEKVYALSDQLQSVTAEEIKKASRQDHLNFFFSFLTNLLGDYEKYLQQENIDLEKDGVSYRQASLYLSNEELTELLTEMRKVVAKALDNDPTPERKLRTISTIVLPQSTDK
ncbi:helix-turn-helix domain-containing protein [Dethiobacter alkaliphilus]|uniref:Putative transcriptional regulator n=1 Tax=Dethiobacter alkaliphilus AHT 1 TaxID=555088 RepID=C0GFH2_DETAL|nr:helix-turn-helix domain-containing protein [Dethiobacter alkaliphilus]EEG77932.1 putative transcriptional regulator [Dethiobacter alkaliphilus AHT 1]